MSELKRIRDEIAALGRTAAVLDEVAAERIAQNARWGEQNHPDGTGQPGDDEIAQILRAHCQAQFAAGIGTWRDVIAEELGEAFAETNPAKLRAELIQVAAVATAWAEAIDRRPDTEGGVDGD